MILTSKVNAVCQGILSMSLLNVAPSLYLLSLFTALLAEMHPLIILLIQVSRWYTYFLYVRKYLSFALILEF